MCFINEGRDINEVEQEAIKDVIFFWDGFFSNDGDNLLFPCAEILLFFYIQLEAQKLKDTFDRKACCWWICKVRFTDCRRDWKCQHKVNGRDSLTAHQSLEDIPKMFHAEFLDTIGNTKWNNRHVFSGFYGASSALNKNASRRAVSTIDETLWHSNQIWWVLKARGWLRCDEHITLFKNSRREEKHKQVHVRAGTQGWDVHTRMHSRFLCHSFLYIFHGGPSLFLK